LFVALQPERSPVVIATSEVQIRRRLDDRFVIWSRDGITDRALEAHLHGGYLDVTDRHIAARAGTQFFVEIEQLCFELSNFAQAHSCVPTVTVQTITLSCGYSCKINNVAPVAQMDRVAASEAAGRWFESNRARHLNQ
jgi:hypothetical protein